MMTWRGVCGKLLLQLETSSALAGALDAIKKLLPKEILSSHVQTTKNGLLSFNARIAGRCEADSARRDSTQVDSRRTPLTHSTPRATYLTSARVKKVYLKQETSSFASINDERVHSAGKLLVFR